MTEPRDPDDKRLDSSDESSERTGYEPPEGADAGAADVSESVSDADRSDHHPLDEPPLQGSSAADAEASSALPPTEPEPELAAPTGEHPAPVPEPPAAKPKRSWLAVFALLLALVGLGGNGYLYYRAVYDNPIDDVAQQVQAVASETTDRSGEIASQLEALRQELKSELAQTEARRGESESALMQSLNDAITSAPPTEEKWKLAEVEYLLRIANHRALMERDADTALQLLSTADAILTEIDDFALHPVRAALADEMLALKSRGDSDRQGLFLRLEALKGRLEQLPLRVPEYFVPEQAEAETDASPWQLFVEQISGYFKFRRLAGDEAAQPLLSPDEGQYLEMNLRLMFERAQLALLREDALVFESSVADADDWVARYLDPEHAGVVAVREELGGLREVDLDAAMPDISSSLRTLERLRGDQQ